MYKRIEQFFYVASAFVLLGTMFIIKQPANQEVAAFRDDVIGQFTIAFKQVVHTNSSLESVQLVWNGVNDFYGHSADQMIALLDVGEMSPDVQQGVDNIAFAATNIFNIKNELLPTTQVASIIQSTTSSVGYIGPTLKDVVSAGVENVMQKIESVQLTPKVEVEVPQKATGQVAGVSTHDEQPVNSPQKPWVTLVDNITGQKYCVAIYNEEVNKYLGECQYDGYF